MRIRFIGDSMSARGIIRLIALLLLGIMASMVPGGSASIGYQDLLSLCNANEDARINAEDLAFLLVTHNFDAVPKGDYVEVRIDGSIYRMTPNAGKVGLADIVLV
ncbi:MAG: hypothetical protein A4E49_00705 [Methanosaeta sp. PtaU1.Bin112]|nr:MAG: hypothetical protein A4E49_00705 [Methanosaeta sp. PtaU1.Bin112]